MESITGDKGIYTKEIIFMMKETDMDSYIFTISSYIKGTGLMDKGNSLENFKPKISRKKTNKKHFLCKNKQNFNFNLLQKPVVFKI